MTKVLVGAALIGSAVAHPFKQCGSADDLHVATVTLNPDPVKAGGNLSATITASPDKAITGGKVSLKVSAFGVNVLTKDFDLCTLVTCPLAKGQTANLAVNYPIPSAAPALTAQAEFDVTDASGAALDCIKMDVQVVKSSTQLFGAAKGLTEENHQFLFNQWVKQFGKQYEMHEFFGRYNQFKENMESIQAHESQGHDWTQAMNQFGDLSKDEFRDQYTGYHTAQNKLMKSKNYADLSGVEAADSIDWRTKGAVSPVKNQGQCGSCWAFSTVGSIEGANEISTGKIQQFSEQELVDCAGSEGNQGCNGGLMDNGFKWVEKNGLCKEDDYTPYSASDGTCTKSSCKSAVSVTGFKDVTAGSESDLAKALNINPVSIAIEADQSGFQFYSSGVFSGTCGKQLDHGVLAVGYGTMDSKDYWIVKNSWGATWGDSGYIMIERGSDKCGIADAASYPIVGKN